MQATMVLLTAACMVVGCGESIPSPRPAAPASQPTAELASSDRFVFERPEMGTLFRIVLYAPNQTAANAAAAAAWERVEQLNHALSDYDPNSELSRLCSRTDDGPMTEPVHVGEDLWDVVSTAVEASRLSDGAFDITVGPLTRLQRAMRKTRQMPTDEQLAQAKACVGWQYIKLDPAHHGIQLLHRGMRLDVGGIAKGYTSAQVLKTLRGLGINRALCGAAGDISAGDPPPGRTEWIVGIQSLSEPAKIAGHVKLQNYAVSTSGDTYRGADVDGQRFSHIVDPRTGLGLTRRIGVTALAPEGITADWITKPISILGPERGIEIVERIPGAAARVVTIDRDGHEKVYESKRFAQFVVPDEPASRP
ncbi:MAG TPA: FAD:protein FMN transferase [Tepidisphaeraceae bacterium]